MPRLGEAKFTIFGKLLAVPRLEQKGEFRWATMSRDMTVVQGMSVNMAEFLLHVHKKVENQL